MSCFDKHEASFTLGGTTITFQKIITQHNMPVRFNQATERTASGKFRSEKLGDPALGHVITFTNLSNSDYNDLRNFMVNVVQGSQQQFVFVDEYANGHDVIFIETSLNFTQNRYREWTGTMSLEVV